MKYPARFALVSLALISTLVSIAHASQIVYMTPRQMATRADLVVSGTVSTVRSFWNEKHTKIFTTIVVSVGETYKGTPTPTVEMLQLGGTVDGVKVTVDGALQWKSGEEVLLFLEPYTQGARQVTGLSQGKFRIERDAKTGESFVSRPALEGVKLVRQGASESAPMTKAVEKISLKRFVEEALATE